jgi:hypothetical protein
MMRSIPFILAAFAFNAPTVAQVVRITAVPNTLSPSPFRQSEHRNYDR